MIDTLLYCSIFVAFVAVIVSLIAGVLYLWGCLLLWIPNTLFDTALEYSFRNSLAAWILVAIISNIFSRTK
jgi:hypothetical protein